MKIVESTEYDFNVDFDKFKIGSGNIIVARYPMYEMNRHELQKLQDAVNRRFGEHSIVFIPDKVSCDVIPTERLKEIIDELKQIIDERFVGLEF